MAAVIQYFKGMPACEDPMWCHEVGSVMRFCEGRVLDPGAGLRTLTPETVRCDIRPDTEPQHVCDATGLPFADGAFDAVFTSHLIEHLANPVAALREWLRVVRVGGHVANVIPDTRFTGGQNTDPTPHRFEWAPGEFLRDVLGYVGSTPWYALTDYVPWPGCRLVSCGVACTNWSFHVVVRKEAAADGALESAA